MTDELSTLPRRRVLWLLFWNFFKIALFVVGGGFAIILAAEEIFVKRLKWLRAGELLDMLAVIQAIPGLTAGNAAVYVGYRSAGQLGALLALTAVALPSFIVITLISMGFALIPLDNAWIQGAFIGVRTAMAGLMIATTARLWPKIMNRAFPVILAAGCFIGLTFFLLNPGLLIGAALLLGIVGEYFPKTLPRRREKGSASLVAIFLFFCYFGLFCFGGGSVLVNFYITEFVEARHWLSMQELGDIIAISQVTPGPIGVNAATFIGFRQGGVAGALLATIGLLLPSYFLMLIGVKSLDKWEKSRMVKAMVGGVGAATIGMMVAVTLVYLELSIFTAPIPWKALGVLFTGGAAEWGAFTLRWATLPLFAASCYVLYKGKCSIMCAIFTSAAAGALLCR